MILNAKTSILRGKLLNCQCVSMLDTYSGHMLSKQSIPHNKLVKPSGEVVHCPDGNMVIISLYEEAADICGS